MRKKDVRDRESDATTERERERTEVITESMNRKPGQ